MDNTKILKKSELVFRWLFFSISPLKLFVSSKSKTKQLEIPQGVSLPSFDQDASALMPY